MPSKDFNVSLKHHGVKSKDDVLCMEMYDDLWISVSEVISEIHHLLT